MVEVSYAGLMAYEGYWMSHESHVTGRGHQSRIVIFSS